MSKIAYSTPLANAFQITLYKENGVYTLEYKATTNAFEYLRISDVIQEEFGV